MPWWLGPEIQDPCQLWAWGSGQLPCASVSSHSMAQDLPRALVS